MAKSIRILELADLPRICEIEKAAQQTPWSAKLLEDSLINDDHATVIGYEDENHQLMGFLIFSCLLDESTLENISVDPSVQRKGIGSRLMNEYCNILETRNIIRSLLEVRKSNLAAIALYTKFGYENVGLRKNYYRCNDGTREDAILMTRNRS